MTDDRGTLDSETPYVNWWYHSDMQLPANIRDFPALEAAPRFDPLQVAFPFRSKPTGNDPAGAQYMAKNYFGGGLRVPIPKDSANADWSYDPDKKFLWIPQDVIDRLPSDVPDDAVIVGIVDTGVALGHRAFRLADGKTRVISSWQQTATFRHQPYLPFGSEVYSGDIDACVLEHSRNRNPMDRLDEDGFNRALSLVEPHRIRGQRDLDHRASHGTHVMDLAAGLDPGDPLARRIRLVVVNLPPQYLHGTAGNFLEFFGAFAVQRVFSIAEALWRKTHGDEVGGYPVALNFAYGMMAGPKDGSMPLERLMADQVAERNDLPVSICMPAGNANQDQAVARLRLEKDKPMQKPLLWRILPGDRTSNFLELWFDTALQREEVKLQITTPLGSETEITGLTGGQYQDLIGGGARIYCLPIPPKTGKPAGRLHYVLATAATLAVEARSDFIPAPAGIWKIKVQAAQDCVLEAHVQSDQSAMPDSRAGLQSRLEDPDYIRHTPGGRQKDSFAYPPGPSSEPCFARVTRVGTHNALATGKVVSSIAGYRSSDGRPAPYSATGRNGGPKPQALQAAYPTDDAPGHYGILAAGARDGSTVAFRGTSQASAQATRRAAFAMIDWLKVRSTAGCGPAGKLVGSPVWHQRRAAMDEKCAAKDGIYKASVKEKIGSGRAKSGTGVKRRRVPRLRPS